jgi:hypothetical protein
MPALEMETVIISNNTTHNNKRRTMKKSSTLSELRQSQVVVRKNAPNWPAMVERKPMNENHRPQNSNVTVATSSLWLKSRQMKQQMMESSKSLSELPKMEKFASKTYLLRQCVQCQMLYSSFHQCVNDKKEDFSASKEQIQSTIPIEGGGMVV